MFTKQTIRDIDVRGKCVIVHAELDAPLSEDGKQVTSDFRIRSSIPTIRYLQEQDCKIVLISKLGRPTGPNDVKCSLFPVAKCLQQLLGQQVEFVPDCVGERVQKAAVDLRPGQILLLENLRFHPEEAANDEGFARQIVESVHGEIFVDDCFALAHRKEAGNDAITQLLPSVAGLHLLQEVETITEAMERPKRPLMAIIGGAKIADKLDILHRFIDIADFVAVGGAMANTFLAAEGIDIGDSLYDRADITVAKDIMRKAAEQAKARPFIFSIPYDGVVAHKLDKAQPTRIVDWRAHVVADIENYPKRPPTAASHVHAHEKILDIGPFSGSFIAGGIQLANTVVWNGTMGVTETAGIQGPIGPYAHGTELIIEALIGEFGHKPFTVVGGGDTVGYVESRKLVECFGHVSTGGGASLELMGGRSLPGVEALRNK